MRKYKFIRVTTVLDFVESQWKEFWWRNVGFEEADRISKESSEFGTAVHSLIDASLLEQPFEPESEEQAVCANAVVEYMKKEGFTPMFEDWHRSLEVEVSSKSLGLVGHFDCGAVKEGVPYIIDFKTSNRIRKSYPLQKSAYAKMIKCQYNPKDFKGITIRSHWNRKENKHEFEIKEYDTLIKKYWPLFKKALDIYKYYTRTEK